MDSAYLEFYEPVSFDDSISAWPILDDGQKDCIYGLFTDEGSTKLDNKVDFFGVTSNVQYLEQD